MQKIQLNEEHIKSDNKKNSNHQLLALIEIQEILKKMGNTLNYDLSKIDSFKVYKNKLSKSKSK